MNESGELLKLKIVSFSDPEQGEEKATFHVFYNPTTFQASYAVKYNDEAAEGETLRKMRYSGYEPASFSFELLFDGTGASIPSALKGTDYLEGEDKVISVSKMVEHFKDKVYGYNNEIHRPNYLRLEWGGTVVAKCVLASVNITYDLFKPNGDPLRAKLACSFKEYSFEDLTKAKEDKKSPDVTHARVVQQGDKLPLMCERIYGDATLFMEVARANNLTNYRNLTPGMEILFPPLINTN